ncbi:hypothetical protein L228DRAFT_249201 [Xylona heveae TC161]|uniref:Lysine decarboxylase-like protein-like protein n=1 Tax=Xylona heveae (strain CBS 132557 / TC161) TaxID=1328760 RepID=A0A165FUA7_XYLHT|nr:hypothetical protein L228DRAFT_249201 [Xylona heveae TC161]KZF21389.1 hypothetical protein L228DRAFT_249201 [Xylona heveae TC161]
MAAELVTDPTVDANQDIPSPSQKRVICVFCGSSTGGSPVYLEAARALARELHRENIKLVYGGGTVGLMGEVARTLVSLSGPDSVHGIIPDALIKYEQDVPTTDGAKNTIDEKVYGKTTVVPDMHTRKQMMAREVIQGGPGSGFIALPGGYGTLEELMEIVTWNQLGIHGRGVVVYNVEGYWDGLIQWVKSAVTAGFISPGNAGILEESSSAEGVVRCLAEYRNAEGRYKLKWEQN